MELTKILCLKSLVKRVLFNLGARFTEHLMSKIFVSSIQFI